MATKLMFVLVFVIIPILAEVPLITVPKPIDEFVFVQTSGTGARPIARKEKPTLDDTVFETAHKLPPYITYTQNENDSDIEIKSIKQKREAGAPAPPPPGSIKISPRALLEKYKLELHSSTAAPTTSTTQKKRTKKEANPKPTPHPKPVLTSRAPPTPRSFNVKEGSLATSESEKQRSRIQIKKGPNGQEYEYEYVYYYYDDDDDKETTEKVYNSHDGPGREDSKKHEKNHYSKEAVSNEVIPSRGRSRGRQLEDEDVVGEDRLPPSTRFPPRSRNIPTTPITEEEIKPTTRGKTRGKPLTTIPTASTAVNNLSEENQGLRGRTRNNVRRPSLDLVDNASFNTNSGGSAGEPPIGGPSFPTDLPSGPVRFLGATPNERIELHNHNERTHSSSEEINFEINPTTTSTADYTTTTMSPMDKVALDLYAILQGTQKLSGEEDAEENVGTTDGTDVTTPQPTTDIPTTEAITTTTTTTTTTPAPTTTTTTTTETLIGRGRFRGSPNKRKPLSTTTASSVEATPETKPKGRFGRPSFNRTRPSANRITPEPNNEPNAVKEDAKPVSRAKPTTRSRFGGRNKPSSESPDEPVHEETVSSTAKSIINRPRPGFSLRTRGRSTTSVPAEESPQTGDDSHSEENTISTPKPRPRISSGNSNVRPLRPGPKINIGGRTRLSTTTSTATPEISEEETPQKESEPSDVTKEESVTSPPPVEDRNPLHRLRNRQRLNPVAPAPRPKPAATSPVQVRRVNPLLSRRRPGATEPSSTEAPHEPEPTEPIASEEAEEEVQTLAPSSSTTEEPKGLNKLLAGRRRLALRQPGSHN